jgi:hypothetical protein
MDVLSPLTRADPTADRPVAADRQPSSCTSNEDPRESLDGQDWCS